MLTISTDKRNLIKNGQPFFYLADTCWSAFTNIKDTDWVYYLEKRKAQGFNTLQINILPQWDASSTDLKYDPFPLIDGKWDFYNLNEEYFDHAAHLCQIAKDYDFELALVLLWCNYVPDTWASKFYKEGIMPFDAIKPYVTKVHETFTKFDPIYIISGDTDFNTEQCESWYIECAKTIKSLSPESLLTSHIKGRYTYIPPALEELLDLNFYQSGHNHKDLAMPYKQALEMIEKYPDKPLINSEPCYEEMGYSGQEYGRWSRQDIRKAAWESLLSGAGAGITYGAAGIYSWHLAGSLFGSSIGEGFASPKSWQEALNFTGAWDYGFISYIVNQYHLFDLQPDESILEKENPQIRIAEFENGYAFYLPYNIPVKTKIDLSQFKGTAIDLENRFVSVLSFDKEKDTLPLTYFHNDVLIILEKK